jgi:transposase
MPKLRGVRRDKFLDHLKECEWRFNHRHDNIYRLLLSDLRQLLSNLDKTPPAS